VDRTVVSSSGAGVGVDTWVVSTVYSTMENADDWILKDTERARAQCLMLGLDWDRVVRTMVEVPGIDREIMISWTWHADPVWKIEWPLSRGDIEYW